jgi:hypothetical protein
VRPLRLLAVAAGEVLAQDVVFLGGVVRCFRFGPGLGAVLERTGLVCWAALLLA